MSHWSFKNHASHRDHRLTTRQPTRAPLAEPACWFSSSSRRWNLVRRASRRTAARAFPETLRLSLSLRLSCLSLSLPCATERGGGFEPPLSPLVITPRRP